MTDALAAAVRAAYDDEQHEHGLPVSAENLIVWLCHHHPEFFRPHSRRCRTGSMQPGSNSTGAWSPMTHRCGASTFCADVITC